MLLCAGCASAQSDTPHPPGWLVKDFTELADLFEGRWDNERHGFFAEDAELDAAVLAPRVHYIIRREETNQDPLTATYLARTSDEDSSTRLTLRVDNERGVISQLSEGSDCEVLWRREAGQFVGDASGPECETDFPRPEGHEPVRVRLAISPTEFWIVSARGEARFETRLRRARVFACWTAILRGAGHGDDGAGQDDWWFQSGVLLHDQYGEAVLTTDEEPPHEVALRLRNVEWTYGTNRPSLTLYVHEGGSERATSYAWTEYDAERIGLNLRWIQASCTHAPDKTFDLE